jgi:ankyrin repeat protein
MDALGVAFVTSSAVLSREVTASQLPRPKGKTVYPATLARIEAPVGAAFDAGVTALHVAAWAGHAPIVRLALERGAKIDVKDEVGATALHHAARGGRLEVLEVLLAKKAKVDATTKSAKSVAFFDQGLTPLHAALDGGHVELARRLLAAGAAVGATTANGNGAVFFAARGGALDSLALLRDAGLSLVVGHAYLNDALHEATTRGVLPMLEALLDAGNAPREALLREASSRGHDAIRTLLLARGVPPLVHRSAADAARANDPWGIEAMLARGEDVTGPAVITSAIVVGSERVVDLLLANGARLATEPGVVGPLHMAIEGGHVSIALRLIEHGAPLDAKDAHRNTPLFVACMRRGMEPVLEAMIARGANPHEVMRHGNSAWKVTDSIPTYRAILAKTSHEPDPEARGWEPPTASRVLNDAALRPTFKEAYRALFVELVPPRGEAPTLQGELVRVSHKLWDEAMRNGNGNFDHPHRAMAEVLDTVPDETFESPRRAEILQAVRAVQKGSLDDDAHRRVAHAVLEWCVAHPTLVLRA